MPKQREGWKRGEGPYSNSDLKITQAPDIGVTDNTNNRRTPGGSRDARDISAVVDRNTDGLNEYRNGK
jgi:hypothetical protein